MADDTPRRGEDPRPRLPFDDSKVERLLGLGITRRFEELLDTLDASEDPEAFDQMLRLHLEPRGLAPADLREGRVSLAALEELRNTCAAGIESHDIPTRIDSMAAWYATVASALVHHRTRLGGPTSADLRVVLDDLADCMSGPWTRFFHDAACVEV